MGEVVVCQQTQDLTNHWRPYSPPRRPITFVIRNGFTFVILSSRCVFLLFPLSARLSPGEDAKHCHLYRGHLLLPLAQRRHPSRPPAGSVAVPAVASGNNRSIAKPCR